MICLEVSQLTKKFGAHLAVHDVSFELEANSSTALIGPNGAGKTTILSMLAGLLEPTSGAVNMPGVKDIRAEIGFLPQFPQFFGWMTALEVMEMSAKLSGVPSREAAARSKKMLDFVGLEGFHKKKVSTFSGGMKQRLGIAQAIVHEPKLILLDEPVSALDPVGRREMMSLLKELTERSTILYSTHILNDAEQMTNKLLFLKKGTLVEQGSLQDVKARYEEPKICVQFALKHEAEAFSALVKYAQVKDASAYVGAEVSMQSLIDLLAKHPNFDVQKIEHVTTSLEEIFMKVAGEQ